LSHFLIDVLDSSAFQSSANACLAMATSVSSLSPRRFFPFGFAFPVKTDLSFLIIHKKGFDNSVFQSEKMHADRNRSLALALLTI
jgi:hypothetical protein